MKYISAFLAKKAIFFLFFVSISCNSCSDDDLINPILQENQNVTIAEIDVIDNPNQSIKPIEEVESTSNNDDSLTSRECQTKGGKSNETGLKTWCWGNVAVPSGSTTGRDSFSDGQLALNVECSANQVVQEGNRLNFKLNPTNPSPANWCNNDFNLRSEIRTMPWGVKNQSGTEEWFGWDYKFEEGYKIDQTNDWLMFQVHDGVTGHSPQIGLMINRANAHGGDAGEIIVNTPHLSSNLRYNATGIIPVEGQELKIVVHVIWGEASTGLFEVWIDDVLVHSIQNATVYSGSNWGGNAKWGIYAHHWRNATGSSSVASSANQGITDLHTSMGALRMITRKPSDPDYKKDAYQEVSSN